MFKAVQSQSLLTSVLFRLLLVASLWQGPILWGHQHDLNSVGLSFHTARCHSNDDHTTNLGWHWHLTLPTTHEDQAPNDPDQPQLPLSKRAVPSDAVCSNAEFDLNGPWEFCEAVSLPVPMPVASPVTFLSSYCPAHTAQQLLCRLTC